MKAWLLYGLSTLTLILAGCSSTTEEEQKTTIYEVNADVLTLEEKSELKKQQQAQEQQTRHYAQLYNTLNAAVNDFGIAKNDEAVGVHYAELIDFNNDGTDELYILLKNDGKVSQAAAHRQTEGFIQEIWSNNGEQDTAQLSYSSIIPLPADDSATTISLIRGKEHTYVSELQEKNEGTATEKIIALTEKSQISETQFLKQQDQTFINNEQADATKFVEGRKAFTGTAQQLLTTADQSYALPKTGESVISPLLQTLQNNMTMK